MTQRIIIRPAADAEIDEISLYIARDNPSAATRFLRMAEEAFVSLAEMPGMGRRWEYPQPGFEAVRVGHVPRFRNYLIFYRPIRGGIEVLHVFHGARDIPSLLEGEAE